MLTLSYIDILTNQFDDHIWTINFLYYQLPLNVIAFTHLHLLSKLIFFYLSQFFLK